MLARFLRYCLAYAWYFLAGMLLVVWLVWNTPDEPRQEDA